MNSSVIAGEKHRNDFIKNHTISIWDYTPSDIRHALHMTVATTPEYDGEIDISSEIQLLKTALMYADKVTFVSLSSSMLIQTLQALSSFNNDELLATFEPHFDDYQKLAYDTYVRIKRKKRKSKEELIALRKAQEMLNAAKNQAYEEIEKMAADAGLEQLVQPYESGMLEFAALDISSGDFKDQIVWKYLEIVLDSILSGETYPIFDNLTGELLDFVIDVNRLRPTKLADSQAKQVALSTELLQRLPNFDSATIDEVLDIRKELYEPLVRFRSAIVTYSREIESAAWNRDFPNEANQVFIQHVQPAIIEIEDQCRSQSFLKEFLPDFVGKPILPLSTSGLGLLLAQATHMPEIITTGLGFAAGTALTALKARQELRQALEATQRNNLYFYYKAGNKLIS